MYLLLLCLILLFWHLLLLLLRVFKSWWLILKSSIFIIVIIIALFIKNIINICLLWFPPHTWYRHIHLIDILNIIPITLTNLMLFLLHHLLSLTHLIQSKPIRWRPVILWCSWRLWLQMPLQLSVMLWWHWWCESFQLLRVIYIALFILLFIQWI